MKLADLCGTSASYIGEIEIGKKFPSIEIIQKFSEAMNIQPYKLLMTENDFFAPVLIQDKKLKLIEKLQHSIQDIIEQEEF